MFLPGLYLHLFSTFRSNVCPAVKSYCRNIRHIFPSAIGTALWRIDKGIGVVVIHGAFPLIGLCKVHECHSNVLAVHGIECDVSGDGVPGKSCF